MHTNMLQWGTLPAPFADAWADRWTLLAGKIKIRGWMT